MKEVKCLCGTAIPDDNIYYYNRCNEDGEEYSIIEAECPSCHKEYEVSEWGETEDKEEAKESLSYYISEMK